jgi:TrpR family transcriptional regulator, trp operon repressor
MKINYADELVDALLQAKNKGDMLDLLKGLLTVGELTEIARRLKIVKMLKDGVSQRDISEKLKVGVATVTRGSKEIKQGRFKSV